MSASENREPKAQTSEVYRVNNLPEISHAAVRVWLYYRQHHIGDRGAFPGDIRIAKALGMSERTVQRARRELVDRGLLTVKRNGPKPTSYYPRGPSKDPTGVAGQNSERLDNVGETTRERPDISDESSKRNDTSVDTISKESPQGSPRVSQTIKDRTCLLTEREPDLKKLNGPTELFDEGES